MENIIKLLPEFLANQIAAGEVVQRPASIVKELLENSIDAGATKISLVVKDAGKQLVQVIDNGKGMSASDARMCFERHATSKISKTEDLFSIKTMGFRGEAMASIAAVAQVEMKTKTETEELGTLVEIENSKVTKNQSVATQKGTNILVKNLFYNVPARRNFLKSNQVELKHISDEFFRVAIAHPEIEFEFIHQDNSLFKLNASKLSQRIVGLFGSAYREQLIPTDEMIGDITIKGYVGKPHFAKRSRGEQFFFVNNRFFKSAYLNHAVTEAYGNLLQDGTFPFYTLFLNLDPSKIDVNVHPTKTEIKFEDEKSVYGLVMAAVRRSLGKHLLEPAIDFELDVNFMYSNISSKKPTTPSSHHSEKKPSVKNWEQMYDVMKSEKASQPFKTFSFDLTANIDQNIPENAQKALNLNTQQSANNYFQIHSNFIISQIKSGILLIDQNLASERIQYEFYLKNLKSKSNASQQLLFPISIELQPLTAETVKQTESAIKNLGFTFEWLEEKKLNLTGTPINIESGNEKEIFVGMIEQFLDNQNELGLDIDENLAHSLAKKTALKKGQKLLPIEMISLIDKLFACENPNFSPNGEKTHVLITLEQLQELLL
ncbi:MAG: DNA mismatch repair endonuclease MutL [Cytophagales bacterium]